MQTIPQHGGSTDGIQKKILDTYQCKLVLLLTLFTGSVGGEKATRHPLFVHACHSQLVNICIQYLSGFVECLVDYYFVFSMCI